MTTTCAHCGHEATILQPTGAWCGRCQNFTGRPPEPRDEQAQEDEAHG